jgi:pimeloyl-ACP methyl ester carboxylesterase
MNVVYLHGFASGPSSAKAAFLAARFRQSGISFEIPALDEGDFPNLTITRQLNVVGQVVAGRPAVLIGSSLGGYLAALYAARHSEVEKLVLLAPAFDFSRLWRRLISDAEMAEWRRTGWRKVYHYSQGLERDLSYQLMEDASTYEPFPDVSQPTLILHGRDDSVVPITSSYEFASARPNVAVLALRTGHEMTDVLDRVWREAARFLGIRVGSLPI